MEPFKSREQLAVELGLSYSTFRRKMKEKGIEIPKGLLSPEVQTAIKKSLGCYIGLTQNPPTSGVDKMNDFERF